MVEGHIRGKGFDIKPLRKSGIVAGFYVVESFFDYTHINDGDLSAAGVATTGAEGVHLFERDSGEACFFL